MEMFSVSRYICIFSCSVLSVAAAGGSGWQRSAGMLQCLFGSADNYCSNYIRGSARPPAAYKHHLQNTGPFRTVPACSCSSVKHCGRAPTTAERFPSVMTQKKTDGNNQNSKPSPTAPTPLHYSLYHCYSERMFDFMVFIVCIKMLCKDTSVMGNIGDDNGSIDRTNSPQSGLRGR